MFIKLKSLRRTPHAGRTDALGDDNNPQQKFCWGVKKVEHTDLSRGLDDDRCSILRTFMSNVSLCSLFSGEAVCLDGKSVSSTGGGVL